MDASTHTIRDTEQKPLRTGFGPTTTAREIAAGVSLGGKTAVVTGGSSGIGPETARVLATGGAGNRWCPRHREGRPRARRGEQRRGVADGPRRPRLH